MTDNLARQSHALFMQTIDLDREDREEFIRRSCADNSALEERVRRLLGALERSTDFLKDPALGTRDPETAGRSVVEPASIRVPGYRPVRVIGVGGMATVYEAVQSQPERTVALKVMSLGLDSASAVRRFKYETEVLARLNHPGIARIFEAGTCDDGSGRAIPFFAMELIAHARTITAHAAERAISVRERLEIFAGVCDAVQHGHQLGVIHRDLKPGNVLIDGAGHAKVIDFGIARRVDPAAAGITERADTTQLIGTLNYMSPEQCASSSELDARTDVYSLGVMLFELVVGRLPHDLSGKPLPEAVRTISEREAPRARTLRPETPRDLDAIIARALSKDRAGRYSGADALAADVRRFLAGLPVEARQSGSLELIAKLARRNRPLSAAVVLLTVTLAAGIAVSSWYAYAAARARDVAVQRGQELEAVTSFQESLLSGVDAASMGDQLRASLYEKVNRAAGGGPAGDSAAEDFDRLTSQVNFTSVAIQSLRESVLQRYRESIDARFADQPRLRGRLLQQLADTMNSLGLHAEAVPVLQEALSNRLAALGKDHEDTLQTMHALGSVLSMLGRHDEALPLLNDAFEGYTRVLGERHRTTLRTATNLGGAYRRKGDLKEAERIWRQNLALQRRTLGDDTVDTLRTLNNMGVVLAAQGRWNEAEECWTELLERRRRTLGEDHADYLTSLGNLGVLLQDRGKLAQAKPMLEKALASDRRRFGDRHVNTLTSMSQLASLLEDMEQYEGAEKLMRECWEGRRVALGDDDSRTLMTKALLASLMHKVGERVESGRLMVEAIDGLRRLRGPTDSDAIQALGLLGEMKRKEGAVNEALELQGSALQLAREHLAREPWLIGTLLSQYGRTLLAADRLEDAQAALLEGHKLTEQSFGPENPEARRAAAALAELFEAAHRRNPGAGHDAEAARWSRLAGSAVPDRAAPPR